MWRRGILLYLICIYLTVFLYRKKKEKDKQYDEVKEPPTEKQQNIIEDVSLQMLIKKAKDTVLPLKDEKEQYAALARCKIYYVAICC